jgi:uncharacterized protein (DUF433 family)
MSHWQNHIHSDKNVLLGKPTIKNSRISIELILELYAQQWTTLQILESYPTLTKEDLIAVFSYLKECMQEEFYFPVSSQA